MSRSKNTKKAHCGYNLEKIKNFQLVISRTRASDFMYDKQDGDHRNAFLFLCFQRKRNYSVSLCQYFQSIRFLSCDNFE